MERVGVANAEFRVVGRGRSAERRERGLGTTLWKGEWMSKSNKKKTETHLQACAYARGNRSGSAESGIIRKNKQVEKGRRNNDSQDIVLGAGRREKGVSDDWVWRCLRKRDGSRAGKKRVGGHGRRRSCPRGRREGRETRWAGGGGGGSSRKRPWEAAPLGTKRSVAVERGRSSDDMDGGVEDTTEQEKAVQRSKADKADGATEQRRKGASGGDANGGAGVHFFTLLEPIPSISCSHLIQYPFKHVEPREKLKFSFNNSALELSFGGGEGYGSSHEGGFNGTDQILHSLASLNPPTGAKRRRGLTNSANQRHYNDGFENPMQQMAQMPDKTFKQAGNGKEESVTTVHNGITFTDKMVLWTMEVAGRGLNEFPEALTEASEALTEASEAPTEASETPMDASTEASSILTGSNKADDISYKMEREGHAGFVELSVNQDLDSLLERQLQQLRGKEHYLPETKVE
ncbi:hypothetical protein R3P38DRAFT_3449730 [Favolaschia claudopus]|uniref:Uncharacterized protein n=1 Tax=Favolaschia claudopus TaxID=2862362 RepID=A0AAW0CWP6_9AGAR